MIKDRTLEKHIRNNKVAPSYLLVDKDIVKLREIAKWFSQNYNRADIFHLSGSPSIQVKETEEFIEKTSLAAIGDKKLLVICDAAQMTPTAQNKILKTIEDTCTDTFLLLASNAEAILNTIKSRCVIIYPDPITPSLTDLDMLRGKEKVIDAARKLILDCTSLDQALPHIPLLTQKENLPATMHTIGTLLNDLLLKKQPPQSNRWTITKINAMLKKLAIINRNIAANCNPQHAFDLLLMEIFS